MPVGAVEHSCLTCGAQVWPVWLVDRQEWYSPIYCDGLCMDGVLPMINSRNLDELHPKVKAKCQAFLAECKRQGIDVIITSTYRDSSSQAALYAQGRTLPGKKVTNAKPGQSFHNYRLAFDFVPIVNGKADYKNLKTFGRCGVIGEGVGLEWAGRWKKMKELAHLQFTGGLTITDLQNGKFLD